jgi:DNA polymerase II large subunit
MNTTLDQFLNFEVENGDIALDDEIDVYHSSLLEELERAYKIAEKARSKGYDPIPEVEIKFASDMAERVESLLGIDGIARRIKELEEKGLSREEMVFVISSELASGKLGSFSSSLDILDAAVRASVAILTEGVVAAPIEGIARVDLGINFDGSNYLKIYYAGPIRSAGGTAQVISILVGDFVRRTHGIGRYQPTEEEINRYIEEINLYKKVANLQYLPSEEEIRLIVSNCPICIEGEPTEEEEVSGYRNLPRVETNRVRGGMALVIAEGIALKAPKLKKFVDKLKLSGWEWLDGLIKGSSSDGDSVNSVAPKEKFLRDLIAGRPVFSHPSSPGGFRLRYGRARNSGLATVGLNPASMVILDEFIAVGTQLKIERPGKAGGVVPVTSIEGPTVRLKSGDVIRVDTFEEALRIKEKVDIILDVGEILINIGDFVENNHPLLPSSYVYEWWIQEARRKGIKGDFLSIDEDTALYLSEKYGVPVHPEYDYLWHDISPEDIRILRETVRKGKIHEDMLFVENASQVKNILETILLPHEVRGKDLVIKQWKIFLRCLGLNEKLENIAEIREDFSNTLELVQQLSGLIIRPRALTRIGARMGRPEKSKGREMRPPPHVLFPVGEAGGKTRSVIEAANYLSGMNAKTGVIEVDLPIRKCVECGSITFKPLCECGSRTVFVYQCPKCNITSQTETCPKCSGKANGYRKQKIDFKSYYQGALERLNVRETYSVLKGVKGLTSKNRVPEPIEKGILRARNGVYVFKDGTVRYDMTDLPLTHFKPGEIGLSIEKAKLLGYEKDKDGKVLKDPNQVVELKPQDVIISKKAGEYLLKVANFVDELLMKFYEEEPYYKVKELDDLIGQLVIGLAPHTSAGVLGRIIGFADVNASYAHPYFHAAKRRNCDGDEDCVMLLMDGLLNFSRQFLPEKRGGRMDAPLVLTTILDPKEVDKEVHNMDVVSVYPLEFYESTLDFENPKNFDSVIERVENRLKSKKRFYGLSYTHETDDISSGPVESRYKSLGPMVEKMKSQLILAEKIRAVNEKDVAERVINTHFLPDLIGNLRAFSRQKFRCVDCNAKYRRIPLQGKCLKCGGNLTLTVHYGTITKYLEISKEVSEKYSVNDYTRQRINLIDLEIRSLFENEKSKQIRISDFF